MIFKRRGKEKKVPKARKPSTEVYRRRVEAKLGSSGAFRQNHFSTVRTDDGNLLVPNSNCYLEDSDLIYSSPRSCLNDLPKVYPPNCLNGSADLTYFPNGGFSADQTFYKCLANIDQTSIPTVYDGRYNGCAFLKTYITLLNLVEINEVQGYANLQFIVDVTWYDPRFHMPEFWSHIHAAGGLGFTFSGYDISTLMLNQSLAIWRPQLTFPDASTLQMSSESLKIYPGNGYYDVGSQFVWEAIFDISLVEPGFNFENYPNDQQEILIRYTLINYDARQLQLFPIGVFCSELDDGTCSFSQNAVWTFSKNDSTCSVYYDPKPDSQIWPAYAEYKLSIDRQGSGVIVRLILPITLLLLLSALTFWITYENRVDTTITLMLSVSALYIVILGNIPMVGYLTVIDEYVFWMFLLLVLVITSHQIYATIFEKVDRWPLRGFYIRFIEIIGRTFVPTFILGYFVYNIEFSTPETQDNLFVSIIVATCLLFIRECFGLRSAWHASLLKLVDKVNAPDVMMHELSDVEAIVLNVTVFGKWSRSRYFISEELAKKGCLQLARQKQMQLKNMFAFTNLIESGVNAPPTPTSRTLSHGDHPPMTLREGYETIQSNNNNNNNNSTKSVASSTGTNSGKELLSSGKATSSTTGSSSSTSKKIEMQMYSNPMLAATSSLPAPRNPSPTPSPATSPSPGLSLASASTVKNVEVDSDDEGE